MLLGQNWTMIYPKVEFWVIEGQGDGHITMKGIILIICALALALGIPDDWKLRVDSYNALYAEDDTQQMQTDGYPGA